MGSLGSQLRYAPDDDFSCRFLLISSLNFRMSSSVLRGFSDFAGDVAVL
jgi:hypothetical protein